MKKYSIVSKQIRQIMNDYTEIIEPLSLDECYLDVTVNKKNIISATEIAIEIKKRIKNELQLTATAGVAPNKLIAKIASNMNKPDGLTVIKPKDVDNFMKDLSIKKIWGVGKVTQKKMENMRIETCNDLQKIEMPELINIFGKFGESLYYFCRGIDNREVETDREIKSIGSEITFPSDSINLHYLKEKLYKEIETISFRLNKSKIKGKTITLKAKYSDFSSVTRSKTLNDYTDNQTIIFQTCLEMFEKTDIGKKPVRLIGASVTNFLNEEDLWKNSIFEGLIK
jgi:DNA polymerase-4